MRNLNQVFANLRKAVNSSKPNIKYKQIMACIDTLEEEVKNGCCGANMDSSTPTPQQETPSESIEETPKVEENVEDVVEVEETVEETSSGVDLESLSLTELRELYPDIKATSKKSFLEQLNNQ